MSQPMLVLAFYLTMLSMPRTGLSTTNTVLGTNPTPEVTLTEIRDLARLSQASYESETSIVQTCHILGYACQVFVTEESAGRFILGTNELDQTSIIAIRGTANWTNVLRDAEFIRSSDSALQVSLHSGFLRSTHEILSKSISHVPKSHRLVITGHSLGGAEALIVAMHLHQYGYQIAKIVTFGQPKVTNASGAAKFSLLPLLRIVNHNDIVPLTPPEDLIYSSDPYVHLGRDLHLVPENGKELAETRTDAKSINDFWRNIANENLSAELSEHFIANYVKALEKVTSRSESQVLAR